MLLDKFNILEEAVKLPVSTTDKNTLAAVNLSIALTPPVGFMTNNKNVINQAMITLNVQAGFLKAIIHDHSISKIFCTIVIFYISQNEY